MGNNEKKVWNAQTIIIVAIIAFIALAIIITTAILVVPRIMESTGGKTQQVSVDTTIPPILSIIECPEQVNQDNASFTVEGIIVSDSGACTLTINGDTIATTGGAGNQLKWSKSYQVASGKTENYTFEVKDSYGNITTETRSVYCQPLKTVPKQTKVTTAPKNYSNVTSFVKRKPGGLNIRKYAGTEYTVVDYIYPNDYVSRMVYTGQTAYDSNGDLWYRVISPSGRYGYVRSDLVKYA